MLLRLTLPCKCDVTECHGGQAVRHLHHQSTWTIAGISNICICMKNQYILYFKLRTSFFQGLRAIFIHFYFFFVYLKLLVRVSDMIGWQVPDISGKFRSGAFTFVSEKQDEICVHDKLKVQRPLSSSLFTFCGFCGPMTLQIFTGLKTRDLARGCFVY